MFVHVSGMVNFCYKQSGADCYFLLPWPTSDTLTISETSYCQRPEWGDTLDLQAVGGRYWVWDSYYMFEDRVVLEPGTEGCDKAATDYLGLYVVNIMADTEVVAVYGMCNFQGVGKPQLTIMPPNLYVVANTDITGVGTCTTVKIWPPLSTRPNSPWSDEVIVTTRSPVARSANSVAAWLAGQAGVSYSGDDIGNWSIDSVWYGNQQVSQMLDVLAFETCTPLSFDGLVIKAHASPEGDVYDDSRIIGKVGHTPDDHELLSQLRMSWRPNYHLPLRYYTRKGTNQFINEMTHEYKFLTNKVQVEASADWWFNKMTDNTKRELTLVHTGYNLEMFDLLIEVTGFEEETTWQIEGISYDLMEPKVSLSLVNWYAPPHVESTTDPATNYGVTIYIVADTGGFGEPPATQTATQGWIWDGNTVFSGDTNVYGCKKYVGSDITTESPTDLPSIGTSETAGDYASGVDGICRVKTGVDGLGRVLFVLGYSPSIPYWLITDQTVILGTPITVSGKKVYPIAWGA